LVERLENLLESILQHVADGIVVRDPAGRLLYANDLAVRMTGYASAAELLAAPPTGALDKFELLDDAGQPLPPEALPGRLALHGGTHTETVIRYRIRETGVERWSLVAGTPIYDAAGNLQVVVSSFRDITGEVTARMQAEAAMVRQTFLAEASQELAASLDYETTLAAIARLAVRQFADWCSVDLLDEAGVLRRLAVAHVDPAKVELANELVRRYPPATNPPRALQTGQAELYPEISDALLQASIPDPELLAIIRGLGLKSSMAVPLNARGRTLGVLSFIAAESGRRYTADDLAFAEQLASRAALAVENARLYQEVQQALLTRDEFLASVSHDLRNPLGALKATSQVLQRQLTRTGAVEPARLHAALANVDTTTNRMAALIDMLMDVARLQLGQPLELVYGQTDLVALTRRIAEEVQQITTHHQIQVDAATELVGEWDARRIERVVSNLLENAVKYSPGGGAIVATLTRGKDEPAEVVLTFEDHGLGIPEHDLPRIFERFRRGSNVVGRIGGTGIGLAGARQIVEQHGGTIVVESRQGAGTTVTVRLPFGHAPAGAPVLSEIQARRDEGSSKQETSAT
jgi:signal transduction histidine kinase